MQKIKSITLRNFKFFYGTEKEYEHNKIELNENNLLLYGENGSGKSSIYWALYTFLQSCLKETNNNDEKVKKYFLKDGNQSLKNRYAKDADESGIMVDFISKDGKITQQIISNKKVSTNKGDAFIRKTLVSSDFLTYKYLSKVYDFRNSEPINLFPLFVKDLLMFIDFEEEYTLHNGELSGTSNAADWWKFISSSHVDLPRNKNTISVGSDEYKRYKWTTIPRFIVHLKTYLLKITEAANKYLNEEFDMPFSISFNTDDINCDFNKNISQRAKDGALHKPQIQLTAKIIDGKLSEAKQSIPNPHIFLNEARLTAIALAIRFAMLDERALLKDSCSLLVMDDLLLSLDMSNRRTVIDIVFRKYSDFQVIFMTHDKGLYQYMQQHIRNRGLKDNWKMIEMYQSVLNGIRHPEVFEIGEKHTLEKAKYHLLKHDYPACGIYLRKECESILDNLLPDTSRYNVKTSDFTGVFETQAKSLNDKLKSFESFCDKEGIDFKEFEDLIIHKSVILNTLAHNDIISPLYRSELEIALKIIEKLSNIKREKTIKKSGNEINFQLTKQDGNPYKIGLRLKDSLKLLEENTNKRLSYFSKVKVIGTVDNGSATKVDVEKESIYDVLNEYCESLGIDKPNIADVLFDRNNVLINLN
jgi:energy-coupling factor transporter ATP-binding protein EcfA2